MGKNSETNFLNTGKIFNLNNKAASGIIPGEFVYEGNLITDGIVWLDKVCKKLGIKKTVFQKNFMTGKTK